MPAIKDFIAIASHKDLTKKGLQQLLTVNPYKCWWAVRDLNPRLLPCEDSTLPLS